MKTVMRSMIGAVTAIAVAGAGWTTAQAGDREWATAGKVLTGVFAASVLSRVLNPAPVPVVTTTYYQAPAVIAPPLVCSAPPVCVQPAPVYAQPAPVYVQPTPVYVQPAPVFVQTVPLMPYQVVRVRYPGPFFWTHHHGGW